MSFDRQVLSQLVPSEHTALPDRFRLACDKAQSCAARCLFLMLGRCRSLSIRILRHKILSILPPLLLALKDFHRTAFIVHRMCSLL